MENSQMSVKDRIRYLISLKNMTIQQFSEEIEFPKGTLEKYLNTSRLPNAEFLSALHSHLGVSAHWVLDGIEPMYLVDAGELEAAGVTPIGFGKNSTSQGQDFLTSTAPPDSFAAIPRYSVRASAGGGLAVAEETEVGVYAFSHSWLERRGLRPANLAVISVSGDSMAPRLNDGDLILIDRAQSQITDGIAYVVRLGDELVVKYIQRASASVVSLISENRRYPPRELDLGTLDDQIAIIGRVVASMQEW